MKDIKDCINQQHLNESIGLFSTYDITLIAIISSTISLLISMGARITGNTIQAMLFSKNRDRHGKSKVKFLQELKEFSRGLNVDLTKNQAAMNVLNNPGEWSTEMCYELKRAIYDQISDEDKKKFDELEDKYIKERNKFVKF